MTKVTMLLAQGPAQPFGDLNDRIQLSVTLTSQAHIDGVAWETGTLPWVATRDRLGQARRTSELVKIDSGWALRSIGGEDDPLYSLDVQIVRPGELAMVRPPNGDELLYRIVAVEPE
jgi:hypothetical protein